MQIRFCAVCGAPAEQRIPAGDDRVRDCCSHCDYVHYHNPKVIVGCLPVWQEKVLLCKRAIEPRYGFWTLPAGFMELSESTWQGARRETREEAGAEIAEAGQFYGMFDLPHISQVYVFYRAELLSTTFAGGTESLEVALFDESEVPWDELAFSVVTRMLEHYFNDRRRGVFPQHVETINTPMRRSR